MPNLKYSFSSSHMHLYEGGWAREVTKRELPIVDNVAGINMALDPGAIRELHWHTETEWGLMLYGNIAVTLNVQLAFNFLAQGLIEKNPTLRNSIYQRI